MCDLGRRWIFGAAWCLLGGLGPALIFTVYPGGGGGWGGLHTFHVLVAGLPEHRVKHCFCNSMCIHGHSQPNP